MPNSLGGHGVDGNTVAPALVKAAGIDVWKGRWVAIVLNGGQFRRAVAAAGLPEVLEAVGSVDAIGIDMPIGLTSRRVRREADSAARHFVGRRRGSSVFPTYPREIYCAPSYADARKLSVELTGISISSQAYALGQRLLELEGIAEDRPHIYEVHPEVSFCAMAGRHMDWPKSSWNGLRDRLAVLSGCGIDISHPIDALGNAGAEDVVDAAAAAWTADRIARGVARSLPDNPTQRAGDRGLAIWY